MQKTKLKILIIFISLSLTSCFGLFDNGFDTIVDDYEVGWIDVHETRALYKGEQLVPEYIFAVGHNSKYIFAKQHPLLPNSDEIIDLKVTNYYLIERTKNEFQDRPKFGPLTKVKFYNMCEKLNIKNIEFDLLYPTNLSWK